MKENYIYPIIIRETKGGYYATIPNFPRQIIEEDTEEKVISAAQETIALYICHNEDRGIKNPEPVKQSEISLIDGEKIVYVHLWMPYFRQIRKVVYVRKTVSLPKWLDEMAKEKNLNFSAAIVKGLKFELGIDT